MATVWPMGLDRHPSDFGGSCESCSEFLPPQFTKSVKRKRCSCGRRRQPANCGSSATGIPVPEIQYGANLGDPSYGFYSHGVRYNGERFGPIELLHRKKLARRSRAGFEQSDRGRGSAAVAPAVMPGPAGSYPLDNPIGFPTDRNFIGTPIDQLPGMEAPAMPTTDGNLDSLEQIEPKSDEQSVIEED